MLAVAAASQATLTYSLTSAPTNMTNTVAPIPGSPPPVPCTTYQLTFTESDGDWPITFMILIGDGATLLNQVNPFGMSTIFADSNGLFPPAGATVDQDSQFPYRANAGPSHQIVSGPASGEGATYMNGDWAFGGARANPLTGPSVFVAQVVIPTGSSVPFSATVGEYDVSNAFSKTVNLNGVIPEPATLSLLALGGLALLRRRRMAGADCRSVSSNCSNWARSISVIQIQRRPT